MDINYLLAREQISLVKACAAVGRGARASHAGLAAGYARKLVASSYPHRAGAHCAATLEHADG